MRRKEGVRLLPATETKEEEKIIKEKTPYRREQIQKKKKDLIGKEETLHKACKACKKHVIYSNFVSAMENSNQFSLETNFMSKKAK